MRLLLITLTLLATACAAPKNVAEPELAGGESPAQFQRAIGLTLLRTGQPRRALPYLQRLVRLEPTKAEPLCYLGRAFMDLKMWQQARTTLAAAIILEPKSAAAYGLLGVLDDSRGEHGAAMEAHRRAMALDPGNPGYWNNLGFSFFLAGRYVEAIDAYNQALQLGPNLQRIQNNIGFAYGKLGKLDEASEHFRLGGTRADASNNLGMVYEERGELEHAYDAFADAVREAPELTAARGNLERVADELGKAPPPDLDWSN